MRHTSMKFELAVGLLMAASVMRSGKSTAVDRTQTTTTSGYRDPEAKPVRKFTDARKAEKARRKGR